jgi:hypothetical protein
MASERKHTLLKTALDVLSALSVLLCFAMVVWPWNSTCGLDRHCAHVAVGIFFANAIPFMAGAGWLLFRYARRAVERNPWIQKSYFARLAVVLGGVSFIMGCRYLLTVWVGR